ncbi:MAG: hypothetical protein DI606_11550 [Sphingobium sp.]|uniref:hypothetical protein n=1 Tax=Sphingobium sp. TaxID=1912891 RepID=UPI000DB30905|nr:hypothetical protein [Sphingobium sp.]PZU11232.1 MAG: hypothetical protein DI606_11550 [Sphingobium sp.]
MATTLSLSTKMSTLGWDGSVSAVAARTTAAFVRNLLDNTCAYAKSASLGIFTPLNNELGMYGIELGYRV